jgi:signal peptidase I
MIETKSPLRHHPRLKAGIRELIETVVLALFIFLLVRSTLQNFKVEGQSMDPTLADGEFILVNKLIYQRVDLGPLDSLLPFVDFEDDSRFILRAPRRGDIVVFEPPDSWRAAPGAPYIKRVIGLPGETIQIKEGKVYIDGQPLDEQSYLTETTDCYGGPLCEEYRIPEGHVVVLGDNRGNSQDSRAWPGEPALPLDRIVGKAWLSYWPQEDWGIIDSPTYAAPAR